MEDDIDERTDFMLKATEMEGSFFFIIAFVLSISVVFLINRLLKKRNQVTGNQFDKEFFNKEIRVLIVILVIFSSTYILRGIWDIKMSPALHTFGGMLNALFIGLICDLGPVMMLMFFHLKNFKMKM